MLRGITDQTINTEGTCFRLSCLQRLVYYRHCIALDYFGSILDINLLNYIHRVESCYSTDMLKHTIGMVKMLWWCVEQQELLLCGTMVL